MMLSSTPLYHELRSTTISLIRTKSSITITKREHLFVIASEINELTLEDRSALLLYYGFRGNLVDVAN